MPLQLDDPSFHADCCGLRSKEPGGTGRECFVRVRSLTHMGAGPSAYQVTTAALNALTRTQPARTSSPGILVDPVPRLGTTEMRGFAGILSRKVLRELSGQRCRTTTRTGGLALRGQAAPVVTSRLTLLPSSTWLVCSLLDQMGGPRDRRRALSAFPGVAGLSCRR